jgi:hypothetical protein
MKRLFPVLFLVAASAAISLPVSAQTIAGVCIGDTKSCGTYITGDWMAIYGSGMPVSNVAGMTLVVLTSTSTCGDNNSCQLIINSSDPGQSPYWYESSSQVNFNGYTSIPGAISPNPVWIAVCDEVSRTCTAENPPFEITHYN